MKYTTITLIFLVLLNSACIPKRNQVTLKRAPYLQSVIADSATVLWRTDRPMPTGLQIRKKGETDWFYVHGSNKKTNTGLIEHEAVIRNLASGGIYEYRLMQGNRPAWDKITYSFPAAKYQGEDRFTFFAAGDIGEPVADGGTPDQMGKTLAQRVSDFDFGLLLGDIIYPDGKSEVYDAQLFDYFTEVFPYVPIFSVLGNHDWHEPEKNYMQEWKLPHNEHYYSFDYGNTHFVALDTEMGGMYDIENQLAWLKEDLEKHKNAPWLIVYLHHNGHSCTYKKDYEGVVKLYPIFAKYGVDLVLNGHAHTYERLNPMDGTGTLVSGYNGPTDSYENPKGFVAITAGSGGKLRGIGSDPKPYSPDPENCRYPGLTAKAIHDWVYLQISINGNTLEGKAYTTHGNKMVDRFTMVK